MEKAVLKTLIYAGIFDYPLTIFEIHKWLIGKKANLRQIEKALKSLNQKSKIKNQNGYFFLSKANKLISKRRQREKQSDKYLRKAVLIAQILRLIPAIKLIGISGGLALNNASKSDDIDLFIITSKNRLWISRLLILGLLSLMGQRRKAADSKRQAAGKLCLNTVLDENFLEQSSKDIYVAHEVLQMKVLWQRDGIYQKYLEENFWAFKFLPNWTVSSPSLRANVVKRGNLQRGGKIASSLILLAMTIENVAKWFQLKIMQPAKGMERIEEGALYFHPNDYRLSILQQYKLHIKNLS